MLRTVWCIVVFLQICDCTVSVVQPPNGIMNVRRLTYLRGITCGVSTEGFFILHTNGSVTTVDPPNTSNFWWTNLQATNDYFITWQLPGEYYISKTCESGSWKKFHLPGLTQRDHFASFNALGRGNSFIMAYQGYNNATFFEIESDFSNFTTHVWSKSYSGVVSPGCDITYVGYFSRNQTYYVGFIATQIYSCPGSIGFKSLDFDEVSTRLRGSVMGIGEYLYAGLGDKLVGCDNAGCKDLFTAPDSYTKYNCIGYNPGMCWKGVAFQGQLAVEGNFVSLLLTFGNCPAEAATLNSSFPYGTIYGSSTNGQLTHSYGASALLTHMVAGRTNPGSYPIKPWFVGMGCFGASSVSKDGFHWTTPTTEVEGGGYSTGLVLPTWQFPTGGCVQQGSIWTHKQNEKVYSSIYSTHCDTNWNVIETPAPHYWADITYTNNEYFFSTPTVTPGTGVPNWPCVGVYRASSLRGPYVEAICHVGFGGIHFASSGKTLLGISVGSTTTVYTTEDGFRDSKYKEYSFSSNQCFPSQNARVTIFGSKASPLQLFITSPTSSNNPVCISTDGKTWNTTNIHGWTANFITGDQTQPPITELYSPSLKQVIFYAFGQDPLDYSRAFVSLTWNIYYPPENKNWRLIAKDAEWMGRQLYHFNSSTSQAGRLYSPSEKYGSVWYADIPSGFKWEWKYVNVSSSAYVARMYQEDNVVYAVDNYGAIYSL